MVPSPSETVLFRRQELAEVPRAGRAGRRPVQNGPVTVRQQVDRLADLGVATVAGITVDAFAKLGDGLTGEGIVCVHPALVPASQLAPLLRFDSKPGFVVEDLTDLDEFTPIKPVHLPEEPLYVLRGVDRGDDLSDATPNAALPEILQRGRTPLTISEGISWLLQEPHRLQANRCFMCIGSRKPTARGLDARTPAIWISRGTGRDGPARRNAPKVGWCWAGNHHSWLGFASATDRS